MATCNFSMHQTTMYETHTHMVMPFHAHHGGSITKTCTVGIASGIPYQHTMGTILSPNPPLHREQKQNTEKAIFGRFYSLKFFFGGGGGGGGGILNF